MKNLLPVKMSALGGTWRLRKSCDCSTHTLSTDSSSCCYLCTFPMTWFTASLMKLSQLWLRYRNNLVHRWEVLSTSKTCSALTSVPTDGFQCPGLQLIKSLSILPWKQPPSCSTRVHLKDLVLIANMCPHLQYFISGWNSDAVMILKHCSGGFEWISRLSIAKSPTGKS